MWELPNVSAAEDVNAKFVYEKKVFNGGGSGDEVVA